MKSNRIILATMAAVCGLTASGFAAADHVLISEVLMDAPNDNATTFESDTQSSEFVEIYNPTTTAVDLSNYYLTDYVNYGTLPAGSFDYLDTADYMLKFPDGTMLEPGAVAVVTLDAATFFATPFASTQFGATAAGFFAQENSPLLFEISDTDAAVPQMVNLKVGAPKDLTFAKTNGGEFVTLFSWDDTADDLVKDVDSFRYAGPSAGNQPVDKATLGAIDGPDADSDTSTYATDALLTTWDFVGAEDPDCVQRVNAVEVGEVVTGGNGITGHDETTEEVLTTFIAVDQASPTPGTPHADLVLTSAVKDWTLY